MGVPKFYRWTSERYPCLSQVIREHQIPEFDNLYLDMNGIIHVCSHPNDDDPHFRISEAEIFKNIFHYIEVLFRIIKPQRNFFMAVDGVAPRAKMNQQRGRRFRTAKEAQDNIRRALQKGEKLPKEERFDSNCITPGTDFMARLNDQLQYFVNMKVSSDPLWQTCNIFLSGHDVPGEGEHKIMDFIRYEKAKEDYDANTRHCLYGLDADLIMLGLVSHEPHFSLLREEVRFGKQSKRVTKPEETVFHLLHLSLMREYLDFEFSALKDKLSFEYDLERLIDDWVLLGFLVGNDFIPHLPNMHINHDALPYLYRVYIETMPKLDGYLHENGILNLSRFQMFLDALAKFDRDRFEDEYSDMKWLEGKMGRSVTPKKKRDNGKKMKFSQLVSQVEDDIMMPVRNPYMALADVSDAFDDSLMSSPQRIVDNDDMEDDELENRFSGLGFKDTEGGEDIFELEFRQHKRAYYIEKFDIPVADDAFIAKVAFEFILAIQWNLHYYYNGIQSWSWYYPFHYSPYVSDLVNIESFDLKMEKAKPFRPFEQLLAVLPSYSKKLLPEAFQSLMVMDTSPIIDYYPTEFRTDLNGKQQEWEAVVLIPFIQEQRLLSAMAPNYARLTDEEKHRNSFGKCLKYRYSKNVNFKFSSTYPGEFRDIDVCRASCEKIDMDEFRIDIRDIKKGLCDGVQLDVYFPGFPTLKHLDHNTELRKAGVRVFSYSSKGKNMVININEIEKPDYETMRSLVGKVVYVEWPYLVEALVTGITDGERKFIWKEHENVVQEDVMNKNKITDATNWMKIVRTNSVERKGIDPGVVSVLVEAKLLKGKRYVCGPKGLVKNEKEWAPTHSFFPYQAVVKDLTVHKAVYQKDFESIEDLYPVGSQCFMMASPHYGCAGEVLEIDHQASRVRVSLSVPPEPDLSDVITNQSRISDRYYSFESAARKVGISSKLLSRITGSIFVAKNGSSANSERANLGLKLKFSGQNREVIGYARRDEDGWKFSDTAVDVLCTYVQRFPELFEKLSRLREQECYNEDVLFPEENGEDSLEDVLAFLKGLACTKIDAVKCGSTFLDEKIVAAIEDAVEVAKTERHLAKCVKVKVKPYVLFRPTAEFGSLVADPSTDYYLFDRVVNIRDNGAVPLGYRGTIIGVHEVKEDDKKDDSPSELKYEVLFDEAFLGGLKLRCEQNKGAYMTSSSLLNISYGERKEALKRGYSPGDITRLQGKAEPRDMKTPSSASREYSPFSPPRNRDRYQESTPTGRPRESPAYRGGSPQRGNPAGRYGSGRRYQGIGSSGGYREKEDDQLKSPDYWLKGYGRGGIRDKSLPQGSRDYKSPKLDRFNVLDKEPTKDRPVKDDEFNALLMKLTDKETKTSSVKEGKQRPQKDAGSLTTTLKSPIGAKNVDKEGTALLQQLLSIKQSSPKLKDESKRQEKPSSPPQRAPSNTIFNQLFQSPEPSSPLMNIPASPTSPLVPGANPPPTKALQNWCHENHMPAPSYTYSCTPQGVHAVVKIGPALCYGGLMNKSKNEAAESAAANALGNLMQRHAQITAAKSPNNPMVRMPSVQSPHWPPVFMGHRHSTPGIAQHQSQGFVRLPEQQQQHPIQLRHQPPIQLAQQQACTSPGQPGIRMQQIPVMNQSALMMQRGAMIPQMIFQQQPQQQQQHILQHQPPPVALHRHPNPHAQQIRSPVMENVPQNKQQKAQSPSFHKSQTQQIHEKRAKGTTGQQEGTDRKQGEIASRQMVDVSKPTFVPLQVNRKSKAASSKEQKAENDKEAKTLDVTNMTQRTSPNVDLMSFDDNTIEPKPSNKAPIEHQRHFTADTSAQEPARQIPDVVASNDLPSARSQSSPSNPNEKLPKDLADGEKGEAVPRQRKEKGGRKNILLAPSFFAPKK